MRRRRVAIFGGSFNPPALHHRVIAERLAREFDQVIVLPCGPRPDKAPTNDVAPVHRAALADLGFAGLRRVRVDLRDLESGTFRRSHELDEYYGSEGEVWHVVGADLVKPVRRERSAIQREWEKGERLWREARFAVVTRPGFPLVSRDLPPHHRVIEVMEPGSSTQIRGQIFHHENADPLLSPAVASYIRRYGLYRGTPPSVTSTLNLDEVRPLVLADRANPIARKIAKRMRSSRRPNIAVVIGGDGAMLRAIRSEWRRRLPFYGLNAGHRGFLLNEKPIAPGELILQHLPLLWVETLAEDGSHAEALAFNDAWVERATGQTAWLELRVNGMSRVPRLVADGCLVATAAGSSSYAHAMGAPPLPVGTPALILVGSNVLKPSGWRPVILTLDDEVEFATLAPERRPLFGYIDGVSQGRVRRMRIRASRAASVELAFAPGHDPSAKLARLQFP